MIPSISEYDGWRNSPVGRWFFDTYLQGYADASAGINGRAVGGVEDTSGKEFLTYVKNAGVISGVEYAILSDPFEEEREEREHEDTSGGETPTG